MIRPFKISAHLNWFESEKCISPQSILVCLDVIQKPKYSCVFLAKKNQKTCLQLFFQKGPVCNIQWNEITFFVYFAKYADKFPISFYLYLLKQGREREEVNVSRLFKWNKKKVKSFENDESSFFLWQKNSKSKRFTLL